MQIATEANGILLGIVVGSADALLILLYGIAIWNKMIQPSRWFGWVNATVVVTLTFASMAFIESQVNQVVPFRPEIGRNAGLCWAVLNVISMGALLTVIIARRAKARVNT
ncbi:MAG: hypothetical protein JO117_02090 [Verrucomicrobia bacterium]|nr:hypothetical protein [Verrucomicrobiota bacterium]MBV9657082.1 hypothetical protein [Verrucomicrobiota bacterium]